MLMIVVQVVPVKLHMNRDTQRPSWPAQVGDSLAEKPARKPFPATVVPLRSYYRAHVIIVSWLGGGQ